MAMTSPKEGRKGRPGVRCAIYTRKSHEEGLEQDFNSLDAQREACEAYVASQKHEGWTCRTCLPGIYDDGGVSGATLERPALKRLLEDMETGGIDAVVVYKVDRLTRTLGDFARIVEVFDRKEVSFVSITQQFNTTTSMGRLTLNMLLSFAQFEREVTSERIRDKIAASKKRGLWMGGLPPLGYDVQDRKLVVNEQEAETVRDIFRHHLKTGSVSALQDRLERDGVAGKVRIDRYGRETGGKPLARGALYHLLQNRIYRGEIVHKEQSYPGEHAAIVDETLWKQVQRKLATNRTERTSGANAAEPSLLAGLVYDDTGQRMTPSHANKQGTRYRYYVSKSLVTGRRRSASRGRRVPARELEGLIEDRLRRFLASRAEIFGAVDGLGEDAGRAAEVVARANEMAGRWPSLAAPERRTILNAIVHRVELRTDYRRASAVALCPGGSPGGGIGLARIGDSGRRATDRPSPFPSPPGSGAPAGISGSLSRGPKTSAGPCQITACIAFSRRLTGIGQWSCTVATGRCASLPPRRGSRAHISAGSCGSASSLRRSSAAYSTIVIPSG